MDNEFHSEGGEQNIGQGKGAIGKQVNATQQVTGDGNIVSGTGNVAVNYGVSEEGFAKYAGDLAVTDSALCSFFKVLEEQQVPRGDLDSRLREIAAHYKDLLLRMKTFTSEDPEVVRLKEEARQAVEAGDYAKAETLLEQVADQYSISAAETYAELADLQRVQLRYAKAAEYWRKAAAKLPEESGKDRAHYLNEAGYDLDRIARYKEALPLYEQSLSIYQEIGDRAGEGTTLSNIAGIHWAQGDYDTAFPMLKQSLSIFQELGATAEEGTLLNNISQIYDARGDYDTALKYLEQSLIISREIGDRAGEGVTLNNISQIHMAQGDYDTALRYLEQSLSIRQEIGDRAGEAVTSWNIGMIYQKQGELGKAEQYMSRTVEIDEAIGHPDLESDRKALEEVRAAMRGR